MNKFELISAIEAGDPNHVMGILYKEEYPKIEKYILRNSGTRDDALDVFQEAVIALYSHIKLKKFNPEYEIGAFLYVVGCNRWKKSNRKKVKAVEELPSEYNGISEIETLQNIYTDETRNIISELFSKIGDNCRKILEMTFYNNYSLKDIAGMLGYENEDTVKTRRYKCKQKLMSLLKENPGYSLYFKENLMRYDG